MRWPRTLGARPRAFALLSLALGFLPGEAFAQPSKDNASPPIEVPTTPVPQGPVGAPPAPPPPKPAPKPAAPKPAPAPPGAPPAAPAPKGDEKKGDEDKKDVQFNNEGTFKVSGSKGSGLVGSGSKKAAPGAAAPGGAPAKSKGKGGSANAANVAQWPGFHLTDDGGSEVMVEFSKATPAPSEHKAAGSLTYVFKAVRVAKANNQNPLITVHFNTPVASVRLVPKKGELHLVIAYRPGADPVGVSGMRAPSDGGGQQFFVKFPAGSWLPKGAENEEIPPPPTQKIKAKGKGEATEKTDTTETAPPKSESGSKTGPNP